MGYRKCPRCELNYIQDDEKLCSICRREVRGEKDHDDFTELCSECGENPVVAGSDLCAICLKERRHGIPDDTAEEQELSGTCGIELNSSISSMDEIEIDIDENNTFNDDDEEKNDDGDEDEI